jgi:hypothetical protein
LLILTDIGGDPDDQQSMVRLLLYANEFEIEGLIASAAGTPGELKENVTKPQLLREIVSAYAHVRDNLVKHAAGYPTTAYLSERIKSGNPNRGLKAIGEGHDTEGSRWIIAVTDRPEARPLNIAIWGGQTDLAQALWRVRKDRGADGLREFITKLRVYDISDQDGIAEWMWEQFPDVFYILNKAPQGRDRREAALRGMYLGGDESLVSRDWMETHIRRDHGPLGALYPPRTWTAPNPHSAIKEGDTPSWFYFLPTGLNAPEHPEWGGWGGRFRRTADRRYRDAEDRIGDVQHARATVWRWRPTYQRDFQARLDWCVATRFEDANHAPVPHCQGDDTRSVLQIEAVAGQPVQLRASGSTDPDGDRLNYRWFLYPEPGTYQGDVKIKNGTAPQAVLDVPMDAAGKSIHVILEVTDDGTPPLTRYRRLVVTGR